MSQLTRQECLHYRDFAQAVHRRALARLEVEDFAAEPRRSRFVALRRFIWAKDENLTYQEVAERLRLTANYVKQMVFDLRRRYYRSFREEVLITVGREQVEVETRYLMALVAGDEETG